MNQPQTAKAGKIAATTALQEQFERAKGDEFVEWFNASRGSAYRFSRRAGEAPDLVYRAGDSELFIEVTSGNYDAFAAASAEEDLPVPAAP